MDMASRISLIDKYLNKKLRCIYSVIFFYLSFIGLWPVCSDADPIPVMDLKVDSDSDPYPGYSKWNVKIFKFWRGFFGRGGWGRLNKGYNLNLRGKKYGPRCGSRSASVVKQYIGYNIFIIYTPAVKKYEKYSIV